MKSTPFLLTLASAALLGAAPRPAPAAEPLDYARDVRPVLAKSCFKCHGPDKAARKGKLRLDVRAEALKGGSSGDPAFVPGKPDESELVRRIESADETEVMPPPAAKMPLPPEHKELLKRWVREGAVYKDHWAFVPPARPAVPEIPLTPNPSPTRGEGSKASSLPSPLVGEGPGVRERPTRNPIDAFVRAKLQAAELKPAPEADRYTLARRLYLDLIGLPPTPEEADAFVTDPAPDAYERLVDRLLASPHYGERWARRWLDLARYADTNGYEKDRPRSIWPYRDWVIRAFNADLPFDQLTIQQLAGDLLPHATADQRVATGFHRNTMLNEEGGTDPQEFRWHSITDRVATTGISWLGLTVQCAQCHNHKYDPVSQEEYYRLFAFFNNCDEPTVPVETPEVAAKRAALQKRIDGKLAALPKSFPLDPESDPDDARPKAERRREYLEFQFKAWRIREAERAKHWQILRPTTGKADVASLTILPDQSVIALGDLSKQDTYRVTFAGPVRDVVALRLEVLPDDRLPNRGPGRVAYEGQIGDFFLNELTLTADGQPVKLKRAVEDQADGANTAQMAIDGDPQSGWKLVAPPRKAKSGPVTGEPHVAVFELDKPLATAGQIDLTLFFEKYFAASLGRFRVSVTSASDAVEAHVIPPDIDVLLRQPYRRLPADKQNELRQYFLMQAPEVRATADAIRDLRASLPAFPTTLVLQERAREFPRVTRVHTRGEFTRPADPVTPGVPAVLPPLIPVAHAPGSPNRLDFARWLVDPRHPLTARVQVNRHWQAFFGRGIVRTLEDFGTQGEPPTHPELLDWLATEFVRQGWSVKALHRLIVTSATYRQSSRATPEALVKDPKNELLSRGPRFRVEAELVRDVALKASGLLSDKLGGPSVFPPQPPGVTTEGAYGPLAWNVSQGEDRYRRGLYTFAKRTAPYAMTITFDGPSGEACTARRETSNTPLQALTLLNDQVFVEAAQHLGTEMAARCGTTEAKATALFRRVLTRPPQPDELALVVKFYEAQKEQHSAEGADPAAVAGAGEGDAADRGAWTLTARSLLNTDEAVTKD
jgi:hypothetical protein